MPCHPLAQTHAAEQHEDVGRDRAGDAFISHRSNPTVCPCTDRITLNNMKRYEKTELRGATLFTNQMLQGELLRMWCGVACSDIACSRRIGRPPFGGPPGWRHVDSKQEQLDLQLWTPSP